MSEDVTLGVFVKLSNVHLFGACLNTPNTLSETELRAAHPNLQRVESPSSPRERRSVYTVRRLIISMRDSNSIKKEEKHIPHFRRTELFPSGGGKPEGKEGEQYSHVRGLHSFSPSSPPYPPSGCCLQERSHPLPVTLTLSFK